MPRPLAFSTGRLTAAGRREWLLSRRPGVVNGCSDLDRASRMVALTVAGPGPSALPQGPAVPPELRDDGIVGGAA